MSPVDIPPDPEYAEPFRAYLNYFEDLAWTIEELYGLKESLVAGVHDGVEEHLRTKHIQKRSLVSPSLIALEEAFQKSWANLRCLDLVVKDSKIFPEEFNIWVPVQAYYAVYHAVIGFAISSGQLIPRDHAKGLKLMGKEVERGSLPFPWSAWCIGNPHNGDLQFDGLTPSDGSVHVLSLPDPRTSADRLAMFLRTTRKKELDRRFHDERQRKIKPGCKRRNLSAAEKERLAEAMGPTTLFDLLWRIRKKTNYENVDTFVLGAGSYAWRFARALVTVTDGTVAVLEALAAAYVGPSLLADICKTYASRTRSDPASAIGCRASSW